MSERELAHSHGVAVGRAHCEAICKLTPARHGFDMLVEQMRAQGRAAMRRELAQRAKALHANVHESLVDDFCEGFATGIFQALDEALNLLAWFKPQEKGSRT